MSDTGGKDDGSVRVEQRRTLSLKRDTDTVRQSFSGGRSKSVVVEKKRRRISTPAERTEETVQSAPAKPAGKPAAPAAERPQPAARPRSSTTVLRSLTNDERDARAQALADAKVREAEDRKRAEEDAKRRAQEDETRAI
ncbi:MAG TPA: translation initiation factor IF-2 associated domain-containing protein, partial [Afifellaceae bacterium]|nr:translation initiation factor IF-2 associated domain-containing protein [Afifellaceae bacterium]